MGILTIRQAAVAALCVLLTHFAYAETRALLVGVSAYPNLAGKNLEGPINDLRLMRSAIASLAVRPENVTELSESAGLALLPTRSNILANLEQLSTVSRPGDWVFVYFSGHGAQLPQSPATRRAHLEADGLDEVFLPRDTTRWVPSRGVVEGAIVDDEFGAAFDRIRARGAHLWAIFDTCHSGDMTRAGPSSDAGPVVWRRVTQAELGIPGSVNGSRAKGAYHRPRSSGLPNRVASTHVRTPASGMVAFFASQPDEPAAEEMFIDPLEPSARRRFGVFSYYLYDAMMRSVSDFQTLATSLERAYRDRPFPTPQFSGDLLRPFPMGQDRRAVSSLK